MAAKPHLFLTSRSEIATQRTPCYSRARDKIDPPHKRPERPAQSKQSLKGGEQNMKTSLRLITTTAAIVAAAAAIVAQGQAEKPKAAGKGKTRQVIYLSSDAATYKERFPGVSMAVVWGDPDRGAHGMFTKFAPGYDAGMHTHTNDIWLVVLKGAYLYRDDAGDKRVGPGEFIRIPGGHKHWSGGDKTEGALFYQEGSGKFDLLPAK